VWEIVYKPQWKREMRYIQRWVSGGIYTEIGEKWEIFSDERRMGYIEQFLSDGIYKAIVRDGLYTAMGERCYTYGDGCEMGHI